MLGRVSSVQPCSLTKPTVELVLAALLALLTASLWRSIVRYIDLALLLSKFDKDNKVYMDVSCPFPLSPALLPLMASLRALSIFSLSSLSFSSCALVTSIL